MTLFSSMQFFYLVISVVKYKNSIVTNYIVKSIYVFTIMPKEITNLQKNSKNKLGVYGYSKVFIKILCIYMKRDHLVAASF